MPAASVSRARLRLSIFGVLFTISSARRTGGSAPRPVRLERERPWRPEQERELVGLRVAALLGPPGAPAFAGRSLLEVAAREEEGLESDADRATCFQPASGAAFTLVTVAAGLPDRYLQVMRRSRLKEASVGAYEYCEVKMTLDSRRAVAWSKVKAVQSLLEHGKHVVWMDADSLVLNPKPFESIPKRYLLEDKSIVFTNDYNEPGDHATPSSRINSGVFISRNSNWSRSFWKHIWEDFPEALDHPWWEQQAILLYRKAHPREFDEHVGIVPWSTMNKHVDFWTKGEDAFVIHAAGGAQYFVAKARPSYLTRAMDAFGWWVLGHDPKYEALADTFA